MTRTPRQRARRFLLRTAALFLAAGFAGTVAVAWTLAALVDVGASPVVSGSDMPVGLGEVWIVRRWSSPGALRVFSQRYVSRGGTPTRPAAPLVPAWTGFREPTEAYLRREAVFESRLADGRGWPLIALRSETFEARSPRARRRFAIAVAGHVLPLRPRWSGLVVNAMLYAVILFAPAAPLVARRYRRLRDRRCLRCGYPIGLSPRCTECGRDVAPREGAPRPGR